MEIKNISNSHIPHKSSQLTGQRDLQGKVRYKHFEQISDDVLSLRSVLKANRDVQKSNKMKAFKAIPAVTTALIGTSIAIAQPGKLSKKISTGLGFLVLSKGINVVADAISNIKNKKHASKEEAKNTKDKKGLAKTIVKTVGASVLASGAIVALVKGKDPIKKFVANEAKQVSSEINSTKLGKFVEEKVNPFLNKHRKFDAALGFAVPVGIIAGSSLAQIKLSESLSKDLKVKAAENFKKGKEIQQIAREHFDSVDAIEV